MSAGTAFVTGAAGFVGAHVVRILLEEGWAVRALVRPESPRDNIAGLDVEVIEGDLRHPASWHESLRGCRWLFHLAAYYSPHRADFALHYAINLSGTAAVLAAAEAAGIEHIVHTSTIGTIGRPLDGSLPDEDTLFNLWDTGSHYVRSKYLGELAARAAASRGLPVVIVHPTAPVGPLDYKPTATGRRIVDFLLGRRPGYLAGGINFVPVVDAARGHYLAALRGARGRRYILGHAEGNLDEADFLRILSEVSGGPIPARPNEQQSWWSRWLRRRKSQLQVPRPPALTVNPSRAIRELGLPQSNLCTAFAQAVAWFNERLSAYESRG